MVKRLLAVAGAASLLIAIAIAWRVRQVAQRTASYPQTVARPTGARVAVPLEIAEPVYDGKLAEGWRDWGWGPHSLPPSGPAKINFAGYGGLLLHRTGLSTAFGGVSFRYRAPADWPEFLAVRLTGMSQDRDRFPAISIEPRHTVVDANGWREVLVAWDELDPENLPVDGVSIAARIQVGSEWVLIDKVLFTKMTGTRDVRLAPTRDVELSILCDGPTKPISPMIYGAAVGDWESGQAAQRLGGNPMTRLNWDAKVANAGNDWFFENSQGGAVADMIKVGLDHQAPTALVVPMIGWVAKDATSVGFPRSKFPKQRKFDPYKAEAGDGHTPDGKPISPGPPSETSVAAPPEVIGRWIRTLREQDKARGSRGVSMYILDNEPSLWSTTHRDVHPTPLGYDELLDRTIRYATEIRKADPDAVIAGPAEWGWNGYQYSGKDQTNLAARADRLAHGDEPLVAWYLRQLAKHEQSSGTRLLDVLDLHFYPAAEGMYGQEAKVTPEAAALRVRATRALWDPTYKDESWIKEPIRLIPRMREWIAQNKPGLKTSIGEWSFGADDHISGALATAEALGRFGQHGLDWAFYWGGPRQGTGTFWAFRAFRNFDGRGARFLDTSLPTREAEKISLFASSDQPGTHIVAVLVNRNSAFGANVALRLPSCGKLVSRRVFSYAPGSTALEEVAESGSSTPNSRVRAFPDSITVLDLRFEPR